MYLLKRILEYFGLLLFYFVIFFFTSSHIWVLPLTLTVVLIYGYKKKLDKIITFVLLFFVLVLIGGFVEGFSKALVYLVSLPFAVLLGWLSNKIKPVLYIFSGTLLLFLSTYYALPNAIVYFSNREAYINEVYSYPKLYDRNREEETFDENKIYILDFWHTRCAPCYKKFPEFEKIYNRFKTESDVKFYSVNIENGYHSFEQTLKIVDSLNYYFTTLYALENSENVIKEVGIQFYPTILIIKNSEIVYRGSLVSEKNIFIQKSLEDEINSLR